MKEDCEEPILRKKVFIKADTELSAKKFYE